MDSPTLRQFFKRLNPEGDFLLSLSDNSLGYFQQCNRAMEYYVLHRRKLARSTAALSFGDAFHKGMEIRTRCGKNDEQRKALTSEVISKHFLDNPTEFEEWRTMDYLLEVLAAYHKNYTPDLVKTLPAPSGELFLEITFNLPLGTIEVNQDVCLDETTGETCFVKTVYVEWTGRIDDIVELDGMIWVRDYKTTSMGGPTYFEEFKMSGQPVGYAWAAKQLTDLPISGFLLDCAIVRKPTRTGKGVEFQRQRYPYTQNKLDEWHVNTLNLITEFVSNIKSRTYPMRTKSCVGKFGKCQYFDVCTLPQDFRRTMLYGSDFTSCEAKGE